VPDGTLSRHVVELLLEPVQALLVHVDGGTGQDGRAEREAEQRGDQTADRDPLAGDAGQLGLLEPDDRQHQADHAEQDGGRREDRGERAEERRQAEHEPEDGCGAGLGVLDPGRHDPLLVAVDVGVDPSGVLGGVAVDHGRGVAVGAGHAGGDVGTGAGAAGGVAADAGRAVHVVVLGAGHGSSCRSAGVLGVSGTCARSAASFT
jgi:hypothetical protein